MGDGLRTIFRPVVGPPVRSLRLLRAARRLGRATRHEADVGACFDAVMRSDLFRPLQHRAEFLGLLARASAVRPSVILEIGSAAGGTAFLWTRAAADDALLVLVDDAFGGARRMALRHFARGRQQIVCIKGDSHDAATLAHVSRALRGRAVDVLFIDGDHRYEGVSADLAAYGRLVRPGGLVALHDVVPDRRQRLGEETTSDAGGVPRLWREVSGGALGPTTELVDDRDQDGCGIGVVTWAGEDRTALGSGRQRSATAR